MSKRRFFLPRRIVSFLRGKSELSRTLLSFKREFLYCLGFTALVNVLMLTPTLYMLQLFDRVMVSRSDFTLYAVTMMLLFFLAVMSFSEWVRSRLLVRLGVRLDLTLNPRVFAAAFEMRNQGKESNHLFGSLTKLRQFLTGQGLFAMLDAPWSPVYVVVLFLLHPALGGLAVVFCLLLAIVAYVSGRVMQEPLESASEASRQESRHLDSRLRHAAAVESMGMLGNMRARWRRRHLHALAQNRRGLDAQARMHSITTFVRLMQQSLTLAAGAILVIQGELSTGSMIAANVLMTRATFPLDVLMRVWKDVVAACKAYGELESALDEHPQRIRATTSAETRGAEIRLKGATARATGRDEPILAEVTLTVPPGVAMGVRGPSGSGKSTLARVMLGIWPDTEGVVLIDGVPIGDLDRGDLGAELGYLPQDVELFEGSIAENVARFGDIDPDAVIEACRQAGVHDMILRFPKGYDTQIGEGGGFLSGGQRQRIGLARALYGNPRLVVLDEPNSSLDEAGDRALLLAVDNLKEQGATVVLISHRPQIMSAMDQIAVMEHGRLLRVETPMRPSQSATVSMTVRTPPSGGGSGYGAAPGAVVNPVVMPL
ncbi:MAG: type I secretion system permease/ATPase [Azoarcus sp.]|jgi:ATP-binding cassette subfamily C exporter for protease/lipase|nr:type I secretion system permease/ATPase [Azoarcus sp.]